jgi:hypothetical protein
VRRSPTTKDWKRAGGEKEEARRTIVTLGLLGELGHVDIALSLLLCTHVGRAGIKEKPEGGSSEAPETGAEKRRGRMRNGAGELWRASCWATQVRERKSKRQELEA